MVDWEPEWHRSRHLVLDALFPTLVGLSMLSSVPNFPRGYRHNLEAGLAKRT